MKKLLLILPVLLLAAAMLHADDVPIATITGLSADLMVIKHNGTFSAATVNKQIYAGDEIWVRSASPSDRVTLTNSSVPNGFTIHTSDVYPDPAYASGRHWYASGNWDNPGKAGDTGIIILPQPDPPIYGAVGMCPPRSRD